MLNISELKERMQIGFIGDSYAYDDCYTIFLMKDTYNNPEKDCPKEDLDKLTIIHLMNDDTPMFIKVEDLKIEDWQVIS